MSDLKLFRIEAGTASELESSSFTLEKKLQDVVERNMDTLFGVRFLASEHSTGSKHGGRIDSLGLDENDSPVIFEYKRSSNENVINQGLFYLDWLLDHKGDFKDLVRQKLGVEAAEPIDWAAPRLVCIASDFTRYDEHAIAQINRSIELVRYRDYSSELLALELMSATRAQSPSFEEPANSPRRKASHSKTVSEHLQNAPEPLRELYFEVETQCEALGDDVVKHERKYYFAFRRLKNFACVEVHPQSNELLVYLKVDPDSIPLEEGFSRDVRSIGHFGTGELELKLSTPTDLEKALPLIKKSYEAS